MGEETVCVYPRANGPGGLRRLGSRVPGWFAGWALRPLCTDARDFALWCILVVSLYALWLLLPGKLLMVVSAPDVFVYTDGIHRVWQGQVPHLDFSTALGAFNLWGPALFGVFTDNEFDAFRYFHVAVLAAGTGVSWYLARSRLCMGAGLALVVYVAALLGAPLNLGDPPFAVSYAMFYNRYGWVLFIWLVMLTIPPAVPGPRQRAADSALLASLLVLAFYLKITVFLVLGAALVLSYLHGSLPGRRVWVAVALGALVPVWLELRHPGLHLAYAGDLWDAMRANSAGRMFDILAILPGNLVYLAVPVVMLLIAHGSRPYPDLRRELLLLAGILVLALFMYRNNTQTANLPVAFALGARYLQRLATPLDAARRARPPLTVWIAMVLVLPLWLPESLERQSAVERHARFLMRYDYDFPVPPALGDHLLVRDGELGLLGKIDAQGRLVLNVDEVFDLMANRPPTFGGLFMTQYIYLVVAGVRTMQEVMALYGRGTLVALDFSNPFSTLLDLPSPRGDYLWMDGGRNLSRSACLPPEQVFADATYVLEPRITAFKGTRETVAAVYIDHVRRHFRRVAVTPFWTVYRRAGDAGR
jgi:hypothetical protein